MSAVLFLAVVIMGVLLFDTRGRLKRLERRVAESEARPSVAGRTPGSPWNAAEPVRRASARIVDEPLAPVAQDQNRAMAPETSAEPAAPSTKTPLMTARPDTAHMDENPHAALLDDPALSTHTALPASDASSPVGPAAQSQATPPPSNAPFRTAASQPRGAGQRFEDLFGRQLPIWAGGITLAVAGVLLVKYSIDAGLLSPIVRVLIGLLFGAGLITGAEAALRGDASVRDPRVRQALSGAGIATLYAAILAAANLYALVGPAIAFVGLALVTALAMALSLRFGAPSAILGLVGGLAAPALVGEGPPNVPLLSAYLALAIGGLTTLSRRQKWMWLGVSALVGGAGWGAILILTGALDFTTSLSLGLLLLVLGIILPTVAFAGAGAGALRMGAAVIAAAQIALLVARGGFEPLVWGFYLLLAAALCWLAWREDRFRALPPVGLTIGLLLVAIWPQPPVGQFTLVLLGLAVIHLVLAFLRLWRAGSASMIEVGQIIGVALAGYAITLFHHHVPGGARDGMLALLALVAAALPAAGAAMGWTHPDRRGDARFAALLLSSALLVVVATLIGLPLWLVPVAIAALSAALVLLGRAANDARIERGAMAFLGTAVLALLFTDATAHQFGRLMGDAAAVPLGQALLRWGVVALAAAVGACRLTARGQSAAAILAAILVYGVIAQFAPVWSLPIIASVGLLAMVVAGRHFASLPSGAAGAGFAAIALLWALEPLVQWLVPALASVAGEPMLARDLPSIEHAFTRLAIPAAIALLAAWRGLLAAKPSARRAAIALGALLAMVAIHSLYKRFFDLMNAADLIRLGMAERMLWEALLLGTGVALWRWKGNREAALAAAVAAVAHGLWYGQMLYNPLLTDVAVGAWPLVNLLMPTFAILFAALWVIERTASLTRAHVEHGIVAARMILIALFAYASLRQLFCGSILVGIPVGGTESIAMSVLAIALAIGFLLWGIHSGRHDWRIGSLMLMLAAVAKVFLMDAAGLEGLLRIGSFLALGFSLIGIGWLYSRYLRSSAMEGQP